MMCKLSRIEEGIVLCSNDCSADVMLVDFGEDGIYLKSDILTISYDTFKKEEDKLKLRRGDVVQININIKRSKDITKYDEDDVRDLEEGFREQNEEHWFTKKLPLDYFKDLQKSLSECIDAPNVIILNDKKRCPHCNAILDKPLSMNKNRFVCDECKKFSTNIAPRPASKEDEE